MLRKVSLGRIGVLSCAMAFALTLMSTTVDAQEKAFQITGEGVATKGIPLPGDAPREHCIVGHATHMGLHTGEGKVQTDNADFSNFPDEIIGEFGSGAPFEFVAANGDKLACHYGRVFNGEDVLNGAETPGTFVLTNVDTGNGKFMVEAFWIAEFVPQTALCTGRFAGITGGWIMFAQSEPFELGAADPVNYEWYGEGTLNFQMPAE